MANRRIHAQVRGRVQGVYFRQSTRDEAKRLGLSGWVRNRWDGSVELEAIGESAAIDALLKWLRHGPELAVVQGVDWQDLECTGQDAQKDAAKLDFQVQATV